MQPLVDHRNLRIWTQEGKWTLGVGYSQVTVSEQAGQELIRMGVPQVQDPWAELPPVEPELLLLVRTRALQGPPHLSITPAEAGFIWQLIQTEPVSLPPQMAQLVQSYQLATWEAERAKTAAEAALKPLQNWVEQYYQGGGLQVTGKTCGQSPFKLEVKANGRCIFCRCRY